MPVDSRLLPLHPSVLQNLFSKDCSLENYDFSAMKDTEISFQPEIGRNIACLLRFLKPLFNANLALDLGTSYGFSAMLLADIVGKNGHVMSIEKDSELVKLSRTNIHNSGYDGKVAVLEGDAFELVKEMQGPFDLILLDIDKHVYSSILESIINLLNVDGYLIVDDIGFAAREFPKALRHHNIHMANFVGKLLKREDLESIYIPVDDGIAICRKKATEDSSQLSFFADNLPETENTQNSDESSSIDIPEIFADNSSEATETPQEGV